MKFYNYIRENVLVPRNIEGRKDKLKQDLIKMLSQEVIKGDLYIDESFLEVPEDLIKVKEIIGNVTVTTDFGYIPSWLKGIKIEGDFDCSGLGLTSLKNCPYYVGGDFFCDNNKLESLEGCPKYIGGDIYCWKNKVKLELPEGVKLKGKLRYGTFN